MGEQKHVLKTDRLILRNVTLKDAVFMLALLNTDGWIKYIGDRGVKTIEQAEEYIAQRIEKSYVENGFGLWLVEEKITQTDLGLCGLIKRDTLEDIDIGFAFLPEYTGKGYAQESASAVMDYAKNHLEIKKIVAITTPENTNSIQLLGKIGFRFVRKFIFEEREELFLFSN